MADQKKTESMAEARSPKFCWLPICNRLRTHPGWVEPKVYFRIVHAAQDSHNVAPVAAYREQTVEIAQNGPRGAFENGNMGTWAEGTARLNSVRGPT